jgi:signal peptidase II
MTIDLWKPYLQIMSLAGLDQILKQLVLQAAAHGQGFVHSVPVKGLIFQISPINNDGMPFSFHQNDTPIWIPIVLSFISIGILAMLVYILTRFKFSSKIRTGLIFLSGGGLGNVLDRILRSGGVVDYFFITIQSRSIVINLADVLLVIGMFVVLSEMMLRILHEEKQ